MSEEKKNCCRTMNFGTSISIPTYLVGVFVKIFSKKQGEKVCEATKKINQMLIESQANHEEIEKQYQELDDR